jgi:hypothetical protein
MKTKPTHIPILNDVYFVFLKNVKKSSKPFSFEDVYGLLGAASLSKRSTRKMLDKAINKSVIKLVSKDLYARKDLDLLSL